LARRCIQAYVLHDAARTAKLAALIAREGGRDFACFRRFSDAAFGYRLGDTLVLVFRGTTGGWNALRQWPLTNLRAFPLRRPLRHLGFQLAWKRLRPQVLEWIERAMPAGGRLMLAGHSLGGAIAIIAAYELAERDHVRAVVTIGAPRVGLTEFRDRYLTKPNRPPGDGPARAKLGEVTCRITHADDIVSRVPPGPIFRHVGAAWRLDGQGRLTAGESRGATDRFIARIDACIGWGYRQLDAARAPQPAFVRPRGADAYAREKADAYARKKHGRAASGPGPDDRNWWTVRTAIPDRRERQRTRTRGQGCDPIAGAIPGVLDSDADRPRVDADRRRSERVDRDPLDQPARPPRASVSPLRGGVSAPVRRPRRAARSDAIGRAHDVDARRIVTRWRGLAAMLARFRRPPRLP
jgi:hypothetical protein